MMSVNILNGNSLCRMSTRASARYQASEEEISLRTETGTQASGLDVGEIFPVANPIGNPPERTPTTINQCYFSQLCS